MSCSPFTALQAALYNPRALYHFPVDSHNQPSPLVHLRTPPSHGLKRKHRRHDCHDDIQRRTDENRHRRPGVGDGGDDRGQDAHDAVEADGDAIAGAAVG